MPEVAMAGAVLGAGAMGLAGSAMQVEGAEDATNSANQAAADAATVANERNVENFKHRRQWEVEDLKAAGLNPILSANSGANLPAAQTAQVFSSAGAYNGLGGDIGDVGTGMVSGVGTMQNVLKERAQTRINKETANVLHANARAANADAIVAEKTVKSRIAQSVADARSKNVNSATAENRYQIEAPINKSWWGKILKGGRSLFEK